jgi:arabinofuranan 3-O-arabinosyltransferase
MRAASAFDGDPDTAWTTPLVGVAHQWVQVESTAPFLVPELDLDIVVDARHSLPTRLLVTADDGEPVSVELPRLSSSDEIGAVQRVRVPLPAPLAGTRLRITIDEIDARLSPDWYTGNPLALPVGIAEVRIPGLPPAAASPSLDTGCRDDLLTLDGTPLPIRITGYTETALAGDGLQVTACTPVPLAAGRHELRAAPGVATGIDLDRLVLRSAAWEAAPARSGSVTGPRVDITSDRATRASARVTTDGDPFWLVLDQSINDGWELSVDGARVDGPRPIDGFAAGWLVEPEEAGELSVSIRWTPQRIANIALVVSGLAVVACIVMCVGRPRRRRDPDATLPYQPEAPRFALGEPPRGRKALRLAAAGAALIATFTIHPLAALPLAGALAVSLRWPAVGRLLPAALLSAASLIVAALQLGHEYEGSSNWPREFGIAHVLALSAAVLLACHAVTEGRRTRRRD